MCKSLDLRDLFHPRLLIGKHRRHVILSGALGLREAQDNAKSKDPDVRGWDFSDYRSRVALRCGAQRRIGTHLKLAVEEFLVRVEILPWDSEAAQHYAELRSVLEDAGTPMGNLDMMIAGAGAGR